VAVGTAAAAVPIRSITRESTSDKFTFWGTSGADGVDSQLLGLAKAMSEIMRGTREDTEGWCWEITASEEAAQPEEEAPVDTSIQGLSTLRRLLGNLHPASLLGAWAFFGTANAQS
jgi:hypothetical protein